MKSAKPLAYNKLGRPSVNNVLVEGLSDVPGLSQELSNTFQALICPTTQCSQLPIQPDAELSFLQYQQPLSQQWLYKQQLTQPLP